MADETSTAVAAGPLAAGRLGFQSRALLVGTGIDVAALGSTDRTGNAPLVVELIGSSLGGYYATALAEATGCRAVLLNPAVRPAQGLAQHVGPQTAWHSEDQFEFLPEYIDELVSLEVARITQPERYFLIAATGDEVLDWREMVGHYPGARQRVIDGSDHGLSDFDQYIDEVLAFCA